jgi:hypothetical protein
MICTPTPQGSYGSSYPETTPVLVPVRHAGIKATSVGDRGAAALYENANDLTIPMWTWERLAIPNCCP